MLRCNHAAPVPVLLTLHCAGRERFCGCACVAGAGKTCGCDARDIACIEVVLHDARLFWSINCNRYTIQLQLLHNSTVIVTHLQLVAFGFTLGQVCGGGGGDNIPLHQPKFHNIHLCQPIFYSAFMLTPIIISHLSFLPTHHRCNIQCRHTLFRPSNSNNYSPPQPHRSQVCTAPHHPNPPPSRARTQLLLLSSPPPQPHAQRTQRAAQCRRVTIPSTAATLTMQAAAATLSLSHSPALAPPPTPPASTSQCPTSRGSCGTRQRCVWVRVCACMRAYHSQAMHCV